MIKNLEKNILGHTVSNTISEYFEKLGLSNDFCKNSIIFNNFSLSVVKNFKYGVYLTKIVKSNSRITLKSDNAT